MNDTETKDPGLSEEENLQSEVRALQRHVTILTLALLIVSGTFCGYMGLLARRARHDLQSLKTAAAPTIQNFQQQKAQWDDFVKKVADYGRTHSDFAPIMSKYRISTNNTAATPAGATESQPTSTQPVLPK